MTFKSLLIAVDDHVHFEGSSCVERNSTNVADVHCRSVRVFVCLESSEIFEFFIAVLTRERTLIRVNNLMLFECSFRAEIFATCRAQKWSIFVMDRLHMRLNVDRL